MLWEEMGGKDFSQTGPAWASPSDSGNHAGGREWGRVGRLGGSCSHVGRC